MNTSKCKMLTMIVSGAVLFLACGSFGQDSARRWYLGLDAGVAFQEDLTVENTGHKIDLDPGFRLALSGGRGLSERWKAEVELGFIFNSVESHGGGDSGLFQMPIMANAIYTLPISGRISAYGGAGVGGLYTALWHVLDGEDSFTFAYQGILGVKYAVHDNFDVGLSYKLLGTPERDLDPFRVEGAFSHSILAAFTFKF